MGLAVLCAALIIGESAEGQRDGIRNVTKETNALSRPAAQRGSWRSDLRQHNRVLGRPYI